MPVVSTDYIIIIIRTCTETCTMITLHVLTLVFMSVLATISFIYTFNIFIIHIIFVLLVSCT